MEENILKPGFSINPAKVTGQKPSVPQPETNGPALQEPSVEEDPGIQAEQAAPAQKQDFETLKASLIEQYRTQNRVNIATWLGMLTHNMETRTLDITVDAKLQENEMHSEKPAILYHFRHGMGIPELTLNVTLREVQQPQNTQRKIYTAKEKFEYMVSKNPNLEILRTTFGLEIDF